MLSVNEVREHFYFANGMIRARKSIGSNSAGLPVGTLTESGKRIIQFQGKKYPAEVIAWILHFGNVPVYPVETVDGTNSFTESNLRQLTKTSRYTGITKATDAKRVRPWRARVRLNGTVHDLGYFASEYAAHRAQQSFIKKQAA